jgi:predicted small integral membrane protein
MAWTWPTAAFFGFIALSLIAMTIWEFVSPGGQPRRGILGLDTTRGDRLFISLLGSAYIFLLWLAIMGTPLWGALGIVVIYAVSVFRWV